MTENKFIAINDVRIKASNIKNYGVSEDTKYLAAVYKIKYESIGFIFSHTEYSKEKTDKKVVIDKNEYDWIKNNGESPIYGLFDEDDSNVYIGDSANVPEGVICHAIEKRTDQYGFTYAGDTMIKATPEDVWCEKKKYLYITTYQNDNYKFYENEIDIDEVMKKIDECLL